MKHKDCIYFKGIDQTGSDKSRCKLKDIVVDPEMDACLKFKSKNKQKGE